MGTILDEKQTRILAAQMQPKFLASISGSGEPNVVPVLSLCPYEPGVAGFAEFMLWKTKRNLKETGRAAILALDGGLNFFAAHGTFRGFETSGPVFEAMAGQPMFRYNPYNGIRSGGTIEIEGVDAEGRMPALSVLAAHLKAARLARAAASVGPRPAEPRTAAGSRSVPAPTMPAPVTEKFARLKALKAVAWPVYGETPGRAGGREAGGGNGPGAGDRAPGVRVLPAGGVVPLGLSGLVVADRAVAEAVPDGSRVAVAVITLDPVAYQVKGIARRWRGALLVDVTEAYTAGPPVPGALCPPTPSVACTPGL